MISKPKQSLISGGESNLIYIADIKMFETPRVRE